MARPKGAKNKNTVSRKLQTLSTEERLEILAGLIVDRILDDRKNQKELEAVYVESA